MQNPNISGPQQEMQMHGLNPADYANMDPEKLANMDPQQLEAIGIPQQADMLDPGNTAPSEIENNVSDFDVQTGNKLAGPDGDKLKADPDTKRGLALGLAEASNGHEAAFRKDVLRSKFVIKAALGDVGVEINDENKLFTQLETDFAEKAVRQQDAGGAAELSVTAAKELQNTLMEQAARSAIEEIHKSPQTFVEMDDELRSQLAPVIAIDNQNGQISDRAARAAGKEIFASKGASSDIDLPSAA